MIHDMKKIRLIKDRIRYGELVNDSKKLNSADGGGACQPEGVTVMIRPPHRKHLSHVFTYLSLTVNVSMLRVW